MNTPSPAVPLAIDADAMREHAGDAAALLKALANESRLMILCLLADGERSVGEINAMVDLSQSALSQHLAVLREAALVQTRREAQSVYYSLMRSPASAVITSLQQLFFVPPLCVQGLAGR